MNSTQSHCLGDEESWVMKQKVLRSNKGNWDLVEKLIGWNP